MDDKSIDQLKQTFDKIHVEEEPRENAEQQAQAENISPEEVKLHDEIDSLYYGDGYSESSKASRRTGKTSSTYISKLERELRVEKEAREKLEKELEEIKKISSEISSHLGLNFNK